MSNRGVQGSRGGSRGGGRGGGRGSDRGSDRGSERGSGRGGFASRGFDRSGGDRGSGFRGRGFDRGGFSGNRGGGGGRGAGGGGGGARGPTGPVIFAENAPATIPKRLSDDSHEALIKSLQSLSIAPDPKRPRRPGYGTIGTPITLRANFFAVKLPKGPIYEYLVEITPKPRGIEDRKRIFQLLEMSKACKPHLPYIAHDRSSRLVSAQQLPQPLNISVPFYEEHERGPGPKSTSYVVAITFTRELDIGELNKYMNGIDDASNYDPLPLLSALNLVLQQSAGRKGVRAGRNSDGAGGAKHFFPPEGQRPKLGFKIEAWQGFFTSARPMYKQLMINVNVCMAAFVEPGNLAGALQEFNYKSRGAMPSLPEGLAKSLKVKMNHLGYKKSVFKIGTKSARNQIFDCADLGGKVSVEQYYARKYNITLQHPNDLPVVDLGSKQKSIWVPAELCDILPGNLYRAKLNDRETTQMLNLACNPPRVHAEAIVKEGLPKLGLAPTATQPLNGFGITVDSEMAAVPGRELPPPTVTYKGGKAKVNQASWNILDVKFHRGVVVGSWWVLVVRDGRETVGGPQDPRLMGLVSGFAQKCRNSGMTMPNGPPLLLPPANINEFPEHVDPVRAKALTIIRNIITENLQKWQKPSFILVLLENRDNYIYPGIKRIGDVELGIHTLHMQLSKALGDPRKQDQYFSNVALKLNTKLGGINHTLDQNAMRWLTKEKTMMVGIDVSHPTGIGSWEGAPSVVAVVASVDDNFVQFPASVRIQRGGKEMLSELTDMLVERLLVYEATNKALPQRIFIFRDGVSEGQFDIVLNEELLQIFEAFKKFNTKGRKTEYRPRLSIIICGKRHHARFFATNSQFADRNGNTRPGTVVDKGVTAVFDFDFYLQAHAGLKGTVKPTHYTVIYDENRFGADEVQQGTHHVSYLYARATKAVSLIPPAYYADLACERGRYYINNFLVTSRGSDSQSTVSSSSGKGKGQSKLDKEKQKEIVLEKALKVWGNGVHPDIRKSMFYI